MDVPVCFQESDSGSYTLSLKVPAPGRFEGATVTENPDGTTATKVGALRPIPQEVALPAHEAQLEQPRQQQVEPLRSDQRDLANEAPLIVRRAGKSSVKVYGVTQTRSDGSKETITGRFAAVSDLEATQQEARCSFLKKGGSIRAVKQIILQICPVGAKGTIDSQPYVIVEVPGGVKSLQLNEAEKTEDTNT